MNRLQLLKKALISYANTVGFIWSELAYPLTIFSKKGKDLKDYRIYGNSIQEGTPKPDAPIEIQSVGKLTTKNLYGGFSEHIDGFYTSSGTYDSEPSIKTVRYISVTPNTVYTVSGKSKTSHSGCIRVAEFDSDKSFIKRSLSANMINPKVTFTTDSETKFIAICYDNGLVFDSSSVLSYIVDIQIEIGDKATEYEPYHKYKIPVKARGKNLFDYAKFNLSTKTGSGLTCEHLGDGKLRIYGTTTRGITDGGFKFDGFQSNVFKNGKKYKVKLFGSASHNLYVQLGVYNSSDSFVFNLSARNTGTYIIPSDGCYIKYAHFVYPRFSEGEVFDDYVQVQLEEETSTNTYEPYVKPQNFDIYLNEPLRKTKNYADYIDFENKEVVRKINEVYKLSGDYGQYGDIACIDALLSSIGVGTGTYGETENNVICSHLKQGKILFTNISGKTLGFYLSECGIDYTSDTAMDEFKSLVAQWNKSGQLQILYALKTPKRKAIDLPKLPTFQGTTIYEIDTSVNPSGMEACYCE